ncbi:MAG TPA: hypothetical protein PLK12_11770 [Prolixibacteraceae bacterium]|nr:hypothetical protein [Prolixibacteraceae bacterium]
MKTIVRNKTFLIYLFLFSGLLLLSACAKREVVDACLTGHTYGFWGGLLHGIIAPIDFIISLFRDDVTMYAQNNNGAWYAFGFLIGSGGWGFLGGHGMRKKKTEK